MIRISISRQHSMDFSMQSEEFKSKIVHIHHYVHIGLDLLHALRLWFPDAKLFLHCMNIGGFVPMRGAYSSVMENFVMDQSLMNARGVLEMICVCVSGSTLTH